MQPTIGRIVHYMPNERLAETVGPGPWAAIITAAPSLHDTGGQDAVDLTVFPPNRDPFPLSNIAYAGDGAIATWGWPPRA